MPVGLLFYPSFNICRIFFFLTTKCGYSSCITSLSGLDSELKVCLIILFITPWIYIFLGIYFYEIIPQQFGVRKHPLFCIKRLIKKNKKRIIRSKSDDEYKPNFGADIPANCEDEMGNEIKIIQSIKEEKHKYPLIVENLTKVKNTFYLDI